MNQQKNEEYRKLIRKKMGRGMSEEDAVIAATVEMIEKSGNEAIERIRRETNSLVVAMENGGEAHWEEMDMEEMDRRRREFAKKNKERWIEAGKQLVYPERLTEWIAIVEEAPESDFGGFDIAKALEIMTELDTDSEVGHVLEKNENRPHYVGQTEEIVLKFSKRGPEYMEKLMEALGITKPEISARIEKVRAENMEFAKNELARNSGEKEKSACELAETEAKLKDLSASGIQETTEKVVEV